MYEHERPNIRFIYILESAVREKIVYNINEVCFLRIFNNAIISTLVYMLHQCDIITRFQRHLMLSYEVKDAAADDDFCELSSIDSESFRSKVQSNAENVSDNACQKKRAFSKVTLSRDRKRLKPIDGEVEYLLLDGEFVSIGELSCNEVI